MLLSLKRVGRGGGVLVSRYLVEGASVCFCDEVGHGKPYTHAITRGQDALSDKMGVPQVSLVRLGRPGHAWYTIVWSLVLVFDDVEYFTP